MLALLNDGTTATSITFSEYDVSSEQFAVLDDFLSKHTVPAEEISLVNMTTDRYALEFETDRWLKDPGYKLWGLENPGTTERVLKILEERHAFSLLQICCWSKERLVGLVELWKTSDKRPFTKAEIAFATTIATQIGNLLSINRLQQDALKKERAAKTLHSSSIHFANSMHLDQLLKKSIEALVNYLEQVHECGILLLNKQSELQLSSFITEDKNGPFYATESFELPAAYLPSLALHNRERIYIPDVKSHPFKHPQIQEMVEKGIKSVCYFTLISGSQDLGVLYFHLSQNHSGIDDDELAICESVTLQVSLAIKNAHLFIEERERVMVAQKQSKELQILNYLAIATANVVDIDELLYKTTNLIQEIVTADIFCFMLLNNQASELDIHPSAYGLSLNVNKLKVPLEESIAGQVFQTGKLFVSGNVRLESNYFQFNKKTNSKLAVPIIVQKLVVGIINLESFQEDAYRQSDIEFVGTLAAQVASTIERTRLYEAINNQALNLADQVMLQTNELKQERDRTVAILECAGEGILITNIDNLIMYANPAFETLTGYAKEELLNKKSLLLYSTNTPSFVLKELEKTINSGLAWSGEIVNHRKDGSAYDVSITTTPILNSENDITGFVTVYSDITRLKEIERLKAEFVNHVSHELRTPLTGITTYLSLLKRGRPEKREKYLEILEYETGRLTELIQQMLDLSRIDSKRYVDYSTQLDPTPILTSLIAKTQLACEKNGRIFNAAIEDELARTNLTEHHLEQVVTNLLANAITFTAEGESIEMNIFSTEDGLVIEVSDTGEGISEADLPHVCERFYRGENTVDRNIPGTGLGLSIVEAIVEAYDGRLQISSNPHQKTKFVVTFPL
ncbi:MAG: GAF domain-containing protein [Chloroflexota bacterium]